MFISVFVVLSAVLFPSPSPTIADWRAEVLEWRREREAELKKPDGWLSVAGLSFLKPGANSVGSSPGAHVSLPSGAPADAGQFHFDDGVVRFEPAAGVAALVNDRPVSGAVILRPADAKADLPADRLTIGPLLLQLHYSGSRLGVRLRNPDSPYRRHFSGLQWFAVDPAWRLTGRFIPYDAPRTVQIQNVLGDVDDATSPGELEVRIGGAPVRFAALQASKGRLWIVFSDASAGKETYRIRYLYTSAPDANQQVVADFNRAYNPPCAFNPHTTCPLPPRQNRLTFAVPAGERRYNSQVPTPNFQ